MTDKNKFIAVIGGSKASAQETKLAEEVGREIARNKLLWSVGEGWSNGGRLPRGCFRRRILPSVSYHGESRLEANGYVKIHYSDGIGYARNVALVKSFPGGYCHRWQLRHSYRDWICLTNGIPVIGLGTWSISRNGDKDSSIIQAENAADAVATALDMIPD
jgi:hypothetical protein